MRTIPFTVASKRRKCLGIKLTEEVKDLYTENQKALMKGTEELTNKCKDLNKNKIKSVSNFNKENTGKIRNIFSKDIL